MPQITRLKSDGFHGSEARLRPSPLFVGKNARGCWVVRDEAGVRGGLFVSRAEALRFAKFETDSCPLAVVMVSGLLELDMAGPGTRPRPPEPHVEGQDQDEVSDRPGAADA